MNRLEEFISNHKSLFDEEPAAGHFERLQQKMNSRDVACRVSINAPKDAAHQITTVRALWWAISIAASIAILLTIWQYAENQNGNLMCEKATDLKICYLDRMEAVAGQIEALISDFDQWDRQEVMNDVKNIIDAVHSGFESELPEELSEDMAKAFLADYYRHNLEGLEMIVKAITK